MQGAFLHTGHVRAYQEVAQLVEAASLVSNNAIKPSLVFLMTPLHPRSNSGSCKGSTGEISQPSVLP
jgi:hypothetical protein